jgi:hypothetical protein
MPGSWALYKELPMSPFSPLDMMRLSLNTMMMLTQAQSVMAMRMMGMAGMWRVTPQENRRMVSEKMSAGMASGIAAHSAMMSGASATAIAEAALTPVARRTAANAKRLARRGPGRPA